MWQNYLKMELIQKIMEKLDKTTNNERKRTNFAILRNRKGAKR